MKTHPRSVQPENQKSRAQDVNPGRVPENLGIATLVSVLSNPTLENIGAFGSLMSSKICMELFTSQVSSTVISTNCLEKYTVLDEELANSVILSRFLN